MQVGSEKFGPRDLQQKALLAGGPEDFDFNHGSWLSAKQTGGYFCTHPSRVPAIDLFDDVTREDAGLVGGCALNRIDDGESSALIDIRRDQYAYSGHFAL